MINFFPFVRIACPGAVMGRKQVVFVRKSPVCDAAEVQYSVKQPVGLVRAGTVVLQLLRETGAESPVFRREPDKQRNFIAGIGIRVARAPLCHSGVNCFSMIGKIE